MYKDRRVFMFEMLYISPRSALGFYPSHYNQRNGRMGVRIPPRTPFLITYYVYIKYKINE